MIKIYYIELSKNREDMRKKKARKERKRREKFELIFWKVHLAKLPK